MSQIYLFYGAGLQAASETWSSYIWAVQWTQMTDCAALPQVSVWSDWLPARGPRRCSTGLLHFFFFFASHWVISQSMRCVDIEIISWIHFPVLAGNWADGKPRSFSNFCFSFPFIWREKNKKQNKTVVYWEMIRWLAASQRFHFLQAGDHLASLACCMLHRIQGRKQISLSTETALAADDEQCRQDDMNQLQCIT